METETASLVQQAQTESAGVIESVPDVVMTADESLVEPTDPPKMVEKILDRRIRNEKRQYHVIWKGLAEYELIRLSLNYQILFVFF